MLNYIKDLFKTKLDEKIHMLEYFKEMFIKEIKNGKKEFVDNDKMIEFYNLLTERLTTKYNQTGELTTFEEKVLDKVLKEGIHRVSFFLITDLEDQHNQDDIIRALNSEGFQLMEMVGYLNADKIVRYVVTTHSFDR